jgi:hypothetical protein
MLASGQPSVVRITSSYRIFNNSGLCCLPDSDSLNCDPPYYRYVMSDSDRGFDMDEYENELDEIIRPVVPDHVV